MNNFIVLDTFWFYLFFIFGIKQISFTSGSYKWSVVFWKSSTTNIQKWNKKTTWWKTSRLKLKFSSHSQAWEIEPSQQFCSYN